MPTPLPEGTALAPVTDSGYNLDDGTSCGFTIENHSLPSTDPLLDLEGLKDNGGPTLTIALQSGSPALNAIPQDGCAGIATDQRGVTRPQGPACDIGAYEHIPPSPVELTKDLTEKVQELIDRGALNQGQGNALIAKLEAVLQQLDRENDTVAINQLQAFINQVQAMIDSDTLSWEDGHPLIEAANEIIGVLSSNP